MKLVFAGTPEFAVPALSALVKAGHDIVAVYTQPPRPAGRGQKLQPSAVQQAAETAGIPVYSPVSLKSPETRAIFAAHNAEAAIVAAYGLLLPPAVLHAFPRGCLNIHPSLLPRWRGAAPIQRTIMAGDRETGVCIMHMDEGLDTGPVLACEPCAVPIAATAGQLHDMLAARGADLLIQTLEALTRGDITPVPQPAEGVTYARKITREDAQINWSASPQAIWHQVLALSPAPGAVFSHEGETLKLRAANPEPSRPLVSPHLPGEVLEAGDSGILVACGEGQEAGILRLTELQRAGRRTVQAGEFLHGFPLSPGARFT